MDRQVKTLVWGTIIALFVFTLFVFKDEVGRDTIVIPPDTSREQEIRDSAAKVYKQAQDSIGRLMEIVAAGHDTIRINHDKLNENLDKVGNYSDLPRLLDSLYKSANP